MRSCESEVPGSGSHSLPAAASAKPDCTLVHPFLLSLFWLYNIFNGDSLCNVVCSIWIFQSSLVKTLSRLVSCQCVVGSFPLVGNVFLSAICRLAGVVLHTKQVIWIRSSHFQSIRTISLKERRGKVVLLILSSFPFPPLLTWLWCKYFVSFGFY